MLKIRNALIVAGMLMSPLAPAAVQVSIGIGLPHASIGINLPAYPQLVVVPGYPVYYAPRMQANYFFYDGMYWVYQDDYWYTSDWYNGPWWLVEPEFVPVFILRIPVRYYRQPPSYFYGWPANAPPRWDRHWGHDWSQRRRDWDRWDRRSVPPPAPRPDYQRHYSGDRYPRMEQQPLLHQQNYRYQPRDTMVRERIQPRLERRTPAAEPRLRGEESGQRRSLEQRQEPRDTPRRQIDPDDRRKQPPSKSPAWSGSAVRKVQQQPGTLRQREQQRTRPQEQDREKIQKKGEKKEPEKDRDRDRN
jgi:hypothetical protein